MTHDHLLLHLTIIAGYALLSHAIILTDDGLHWDGWILESWQRSRNWAVMKRFYAEVGLLPSYGIHKVLASAPARIFFYRFIAFGSTLAAGIAVYLLAVQTGGLNELYSLLLALLYLSYAGYHMNVDTVVGVQYTLPAAVFYWAAYLALLATDHASNAHWFLRGASLLLFLFAFNANSTLVYYFGFLGLKFFLNWNSDEDASSNTYRELIQNIDYLILPFVYWILKNTLTPRHGHYSNYNRIRFHPSTIAFRLLDAFRFGFEASVTLPISHAITKHYLWVPVSAFAVTLWITSITPAAAAAIPQAIATTMLGLGFMLLVLAALPYALVHQFFFPGGWATKNHMLFHLPVSLIALGAAGLLLSTSTMLPAMVFMLVSNAIYLNLIYLHHIGAAIKNRSWLYKLSRIDGARAMSIFLVTDVHSIRGDPFNAEQEHRPAYLFYMFEWLWGDKRHCGVPVDDGFQGRLPIEEVSRALAESTLNYDMEQVDVRGPQARLVISDGPLQPSSMIPLLYLRRRWLRGGKVDDVLELATDLTYTPL